MRVLSLSPLAVVLLVTALCGRPALAQPTVYVPDDYPTIQGAIDAASDGWTILVRPGTYVENIDLLGKSVTLQSSDGPEVTIIDGSQPADPDLGSVVLLVRGEASETVLEGFTLTGGTGSRWRADNGYLLDGGGGVLVAQSFSSSHTIRSCIIQNNTARRGAGIYAYFSSMDLEDCVIRDNQSDDWGGAIDGEATQGSVSRCLIEENVGVEGGGAFFWESRPVIFSDCQFIGNQATYGGAVTAVDESFVDFVRCTFARNRAEYGGAVFSNHWDVYEDCRFRFDSCLFSDNSAELMGGALFGNTFGSLGSILVRGCTLEGNSAPDGAACWLEVTDQRLSRIAGTLIVGSGPEAITGSVSPELLLSCLVEGGFSGQVDTSPLLVDPESGNHRLSSGSFCADRGSSYDPGYYPPIPDTDLDGNPRIVDGDRDGTATIDMGCYEYQPEPFDARLGSVNTAEGGVNRADVLLLNGSPGDAERVVTAGIGESLQLDIAAPPSRPGPLCSRYVVYAWVGEPDPLAVSVQERAGYFLGWTAFPTVFSGGSPQPLRLWNTFGHEPILGEPDFVSEKAPTTLFALPNGRPSPITATFQGFVEDDAAPNDVRVATTNGVVLRVE